MSCSINAAAVNLQTNKKKTKPKKSKKAQQSQRPTSDGNQASHDPHLGSLPALDLLELGGLASGADLASAAVAAMSAAIDTLAGDDLLPRGGKSNNHRALVLDAAYRPINVINWAKAIKMDMAGRADVLQYYEDGSVQTSQAALPMPAVVRARKLLDLSKLLGKVPLTRRNILLRDKFCCQYCGEKGRTAAEMTLDHVMPVSKGGNNSWGNLVTACRSCNQRKGNLTLKQLGWRLRSQPREPNAQELKIIVRGLSPQEVDNPPPEWADYLLPYKEKILNRSHAQECG